MTKNLETLEKALKISLKYSLNDEIIKNTYEKYVFICHSFGVEWCSEKDFDLVKGVFENE